MAKRPKPTEEEVTGFVMTPMIDIVFQLIIFFMLVLDLSQQQLEPVVLPYASKAIKEKKVEDTLLIMNVLGDDPTGRQETNGWVKINGKTYWKPSDGLNNDQLIGIFEQRRDMKVYKEPGAGDFVSYPILIRADRTTRFEHLQKILMIATEHGGVYKLQLGAKKEN